MAQKIRSWFVDGFARNLKLPQKDFFGKLTLRFFIKNNSYLERNAVSLCNIKPDHNVLELGFGPGVGLEAAYNIVKDGNGKVYGVDTSLFMVETAQKRMKQAVNDRKVVLFHGSASDIPLNADTVHRIFHCNCYYFWPSMRLVMRELYRVMRPGGIMVTTLNLKGLDMVKKKGCMKYGNTDPLKYMSCLETFGFENVHIEYKKDPDTGAPFQVIFAEVREKPAHSSILLSDDEDDEERNVEPEVENKHKEQLSKLREKPWVS